ncbi:universal stress protein, partial [Streptomyces sp. NPDC059597]|uniref:universal stress protein n=1 Tax=Streptomyces sp. NPDC059597 TaxID=3346879 RepID=UPI0036C2A0BF
GAARGGGGARGGGAPAGSAGNVGGPPPRGGGGGGRGGAPPRLGRPCVREERSGRVEREVVAAAEGADLLVLARDGDRTRLGPHSLGPASRFTVDHAPCPVLLVWPDRAPSLRTLPPPPPH